MAQVAKRNESMFAVTARGGRSELEIAAARVALRSIQESIGALERLRADAGHGSWLRPPTKW